MLYVDDPNLELWSLASDGGDRWTSTFLLAVDNQTPMSGVLEAGLTIFQTMENGPLWTVPISGGTPSNVWPGDEGGSSETVFAVTASDGNIYAVGP